jgi:hypothetical protein
MVIDLCHYLFPGQEPDVDAIWYLVPLLKESRVYLTSWPGLEIS